MRAWDLMARLLFKPFDFGKWLSLGFLVWLGYYLVPENFIPMSKFSPNLSWDLLKNVSGKNGMEDVRKILEQMSEETKAMIMGLGFLLIVFLCVVYLITWVFLLWLKARSKLVFIDNLARNRGDIAIPWENTSRQGWSAFRWYLVYNIVLYIFYGIILIPFILICLPWFNELIKFKGIPPMPGLIPGTMIVCGIAYFIVNITATVINTFFNDTVLPIMYKTRSGALNGWKIFLSLLGCHPFSFIGYLLFKFMLYTLASIFLMLILFVTCCSLYCIQQIPLVGSLLLGLLFSQLVLPVPVVFRYFSLEFLVQFGDDYKIINDEEPPPVPEQDAEAPGV